MRDEGSSNGTFVNGCMVTGEVPLNEGDVVVIGATKMVFKLPGQT